MAIKVVPNMEARVIIKDIHRALVMAAKIITPGAAAPMRTKRVFASNAVLLSCPANIPARRSGWGGCQVLGSAWQIPTVTQHLFRSVINWLYKA